MQKFDPDPEIVERIAKRRDTLHAYRTIEPARTALLVVDMQNFFLDDRQPAVCPAARDIVPVINRLADAIRATGGAVFWIQMTADETDWKNFDQLSAPEVTKRRFQELAPGGDGFGIWPDLIVDPVDQHVVKKRYSAFIQGSSDIEDRLNGADIDTILVTGAITNICCETTARDAMMLGFKTIMVADANAAFRQADHSAALNTFMRAFGDVRTSNEILALLGVDDQQARTG